MVDYATSIWQLLCFPCPLRLPPYLHFPLHVLQDADFGPDKEGKYKIKKRNRNRKLIRYSSIHLNIRGLLEYRAFGRLFSWKLRLQLISFLRDSRLPGTSKCIPTQLCLLKRLLLQLRPTLFNNLSLIRENMSFGRTTEKLCWNAL